MEKPELIPHLFRTEYRKIVSVLCKHFGLSRMDMAEDLVSETFLSAAQTWPLKGIPENPVAWLYTVAKNKATNYVKRNSLFETKISPQLTASSTPPSEIDLSAQNIFDSQLQMMFAICHPSISVEGQVGLSLRILCGFGIDEIAEAFLMSKETINKRLFRAKEKLKEEKFTVELPDPSEMQTRLDAVLTTLYLMFSEGYYSTSEYTIIRKDVCLEAMRLCKMLTESEYTNRPDANALLSLMCFHASRFDARINDQGDLILYEDQDTALWNEELIHQGAYYLNQSASGERLSKYHLEASIAYWHTQKSDTPEKWENILQLYNRLLQVIYSPVAALNRTYALSKANGKEEAIREAEKLQLTGNQFYFALLGELYTGIDTEKARENFTKAISLAKNRADKNALQRKLTRLS